MNSFLFIIPLTPQSMMNSLRKELRKLCFESLLNQTYQNWKAIIIGDVLPTILENDGRFIYLQQEGYKELKLQYGVKYYKENHLDFNYLIRLDDDDIFNPIILEKYSNVNADVIVDMKHWFMDWHTKKLSSDFRPWFPNTCAHRSDHALSKYGEISRKGLEQINEFVSLIETNHAKMHDYYINKNVLFTSDDIPMYLRVLNKTSITSQGDDSYDNYLMQFGRWNKNLPNGFVIEKFSKGNEDENRYSNVKKNNLKKLISEKLRAYRFKKLFKPYK